MKKCVFTAVLGALLVGCAAGAPDDRGVGDFVRGESERGFSGSVLVVHRGRTILDAGFGLADRERAIPVRPETVFDVGSITKVFTAATVFRLAEERKLRLDDALPRFFARVPRDKRRITLRQLLGHRAGLPMMPRRPFVATTRERAIREALASSLLFPPGRRQSYSNVGYALLAAIVERVSGEPFEEAVRRRVFEPAGMSRTGFAGERRWPPEDVAVGYGNGSPPGRNAPDSYVMSWSLKGAGGAVTTTGDLAKWVDAVHAGRIVRRASVGPLYALAVGPTPPGAPREYGYGGASSRGFNADVEELVEEGTLVIVLTNANVLPRERATELAEGVLDRLRA